MAEKTIKTRIQNKHAIEADWLTAGNAANPFIPLAGELIIYDVDLNHDCPRFKIGDGTTNVNNLPFVVDETFKAELLQELDALSKTLSTHDHDDKYVTGEEVTSRLSTKSDTGHNHDDRYAEKEHGAHVTYSSTNPAADGTASPGSAATVARSDHKHPTDTTRAAASDVTALQGLVGDVAVTEQISNALINYYTKMEINSLELITTADIDNICGTSIEVASADGVTF